MLLSPVIELGRVPHILVGTCKVYNVQCTLTFFLVLVPVFAIVLVLVLVFAIVLVLVLVFAIVLAYLFLSLVLVFSLRTI